MKLVELEHVKITYGSRTVINDMSITLEAGEALGLLGPNGVGKTSTLHAILGLLTPREGMVRVLGGKAGSLKSLAEIGFSPEEGDPPGYLTAREYLGFIAVAKVFGSAERKRHLNDLLWFFELPEGKKLRAYSKGMMRRLLIAQAFVGKQKLVILDEPLNGLDPLFIVKLRSKLTTFLDAGGSLIFCSHILAEVEKLCQRIAILKDGNVVCNSAITHLVEKYGSVEKAFTAMAG